MSNLYRIEDENGRGIAPFVVEREAVPAVGDAVRLFNYPRAERFVVAGLKARRDWQAFDLIHRFVLVLLPAVETDPAAECANDLIFTPAIAVVKRLARALQIAHEEIGERLTLHISRKDFASLALSVGIRY